MNSPLGGYALRAVTPETSISVDRSRCVRHRCTKNACTGCIEACPAGAVSWGAGGLRIDPVACRQCLNCLAACPTAALSLAELSLPRLLNDLARQARPVLGCQLRPDTDAHARMPCLGRLADPELMVLCVLVFSDGLTVNLSACSACVNAPVLAGIEAAHRRLDELVPGHAIRLVRTREELDFEPPALSRRELFALFRDRSARSAMSMVARLHGDAPRQAYGDKQVPPVRAMLLNALEETDPAKRQLIAARLFGRIEFTDDCVRADRCIGVCPTGAIAPAKSDDGSPSFNSDFCVSCGSCQMFCRNGGVRLSKEQAMDAGGAPSREQAIC